MVACWTGVRRPVIDQLWEAIKADHSSPTKQSALFRAPDGGIFYAAENPNSGEALVIEMDEGAAQLWTITITGSPTWAHFTLEGALKALALKAGKAAPEICEISQISQRQGEMK